MISSLLLSPPGATGSGFIVPSSEREPLDQTNIDWMVILDPLGRWSVIRKVGRVWLQLLGGRPTGVGGHPAPGLVRLPVRSRGSWSLLDDVKLRDMLISLCNPNVWAFLPYFLITPDVWAFLLLDKTLSLGVSCIWIFFFIYLMIIFGT